MNVGRIIELLVKFYKEREFFEVFGASCQAVPDQAVTKSESSCCHSIGQSWIDGCIVVSLVTTWLQFQFKYVYDRFAQDHWQPLIVADVLD